MAELTAVQTQYILHWGEMGTRWGINRTVAQIHALLFLSPRALPAEEIAETLSVASAISFPAARERRLDLLGDQMEEHLDLDRLLELAHSGAPACLPVLPPGGEPQAASAWSTSAAG